MVKREHEKFISIFLSFLHTAMVQVVEILVVVVVASFPNKTKYISR